MSSPNGKPLSERMSERRSSRGDSPRRRRSHSRERGDKRRDRRDHEDRRRSSRSRERRRSDKGDSGHDKSHHRDRDRERDRDRDRDRRKERLDERDGRPRDKDRDRDERDRRDRRRKREDELDSVDDDRHKRKREERDLDVTTAGTMGLNDDSISLSRSDRRDRSYDSDRRLSDRHSARRSRDGHDDLPSRRRDDREPRRDTDRSHDHRNDRDRRGPPKEAMELDHSPIRPPPPPSPPIIRRPSPQYEPPPDSGEELPVEDEDSEARSVFVSQLAARLTARDLGYFFEDKLGENSVKDSRIVTDRLSRRSKGIGYVEFRSLDLVPKAIALSGTIVMGLPIMVQLTESERNKLHPGDGINLPPGVSASSHGSMQIYVGSLHFNLTESDIKQVFEPFGELDFVDLHRDPMTGRSKGFCFIQYKRPEDARMALEQMEGFELAGRTLRVKTVHEKGTARSQQQDSLDEAGGGNLNAASRQALMQKLARIEPAPRAPEIVKPNIPQQQLSRCILLKNMFDPEEETERDWDKDLEQDVKGECEERYGAVEGIKVEKESQGEIYVKFASTQIAEMAFKGLDGRWFGGKQVSAHYISDAIMQAHQ